MNAVENYHACRVAMLGCLLCRRLHKVFSPAELHHVAEGSGLRSVFALAPLCYEHHQGKTGLHGMGVSRFCSAYRLPNENEYGLLTWTNEDLAMLDLGRIRRVA